MRTGFIHLLSSLFFLTCYLSVHAGTAPSDSLRIANGYLRAQSDTERVNWLNEWSFYEGDARRGIEKASEALALATKIKFKKGEATALVQLSAHNWAMGDFNLALHYASRSIRIKEEVNDVSGLPSSYNMIAIIYRELGEGEKAIHFLSKALQLLPDTNDRKIQYKRAVMYGSMGKSYGMLDNSDSAFYYYQRSYELFEASRNFYQMNLAQTGLGDIQSEKGNKEIALGFYRAAIANCSQFPDTSGLTYTYLAVAKLFAGSNNRDSSVFYGNLALECAERSNNLKVIKEAAQLLYLQCDSADYRQKLKWLQIGWEALDSLNSREHRGQIKALLMEEENRQREREELLANEKQHRQSELNYILLAFSIIAFLVFISLISNSFIINEKWVTYLSIFSLLLVFEFLNLLSHAFFADLSNHSPFYMLLMLAAFAAVLIPIHHRLEKWMVGKLVEKNKKKRLSMARQIISKLEGDSSEGG